MGSQIGAVIWCPCEVSLNYDSPIFKNMYVQGGAKSSCQLIVTPSFSEQSRIFSTSTLDVHSLSNKFFTHKN